MLEMDTEHLLLTAAEKSVQSSAAESSAWTVFPPVMLGNIRDCKESLKKC